MFRDRVDLSFAELPAALREDAMHRFAVLQPHLEENVSLAATQNTPTSRCEQRSVGWQGIELKGWLVWRERPDQIRGTTSLCPSSPS